MKKIILYLCIITGLFILGLVSCKKDLPEKEAQHRAMDQLQIPGNFNWKSTREVVINVKIISNWKTVLLPRIDIFSYESSEKIRLLMSGTTDKTNLFETKLSIPTSLKQVLIRVRAGCEIEQSVIKDVDDDISCTLHLGSTKSTLITLFGEDFDDGDFTNNPTWTLTPSGSGCWAPGTREVINGEFHVLDMDSPGCGHGTELDKILDITLTDSTYISFDVNPVYSDVANGAGYQNEEYPVGIQLYLYDASDNLMRLRFCYNYRGGSSLTTSDYIRVAFPWVPQNQWQRGQQFRIREYFPNAVTLGRLFIGASGWDYEAYYDNITIQEGGTLPTGDDDDQDGVPNNLDDYPLDPDRAFNTYYPNETQWGTLAFEDLWPSKGDYDMNDLVIDYHFQNVLNASNKLVDIIPRFYVRAVGAGQQNGFGWQFDNILPSVIESVTGYTMQYSYINLNSNGTESNQQKAVVIVFDNAENVINRIDGGFYNTLDNGLHGQSDTVTITLHFDNPQAPGDIGTPPYNPFLIKDMDRGIEVHLTDHIPTSLANLTYFGMSNDASDPATGKYYKTVSGLPWAIDIPETFDYTWEMVEITEGHLKFANWAEAGGFVFQDWYQNLAGYRNELNIYK